MEISFSSSDMGKLVNAEYLLSHRGIYKSTADNRMYFIHDWDRVLKMPTHSFMSMSKFYSKEEFLKAFSLGNQYIEMPKGFALNLSFTQ